jgi:hypothetical protein
MGNTWFGVMGERGKDWGLGLINGDHSTEVGRRGEIGKGRGRRAESIVK